MTCTTYRDLVVWQKAIDLCELIYRASAAFPQHELYGLTSQIRRGAGQWGIPPSRWLRPWLSPGD
jgi:hypothetical protein